MPLTTAKSMNAIMLQLDMNANLPQLAMNANMP